MFGDVFGTRADYTRGLMYASRRQYLIGPGRKVAKQEVFQPGKQFRRQCREEILKPPEMFLTRQQARRTNFAKSPHTKGKVKQLGFASKPRTPKKMKPKKEKKPEERHEQPNGFAGMLNGTGKGSSLYHDEHDAQMREMIEADFRAREAAAWEQVKEVGVTYWSNALTGECRTENPYGEEEPLPVDETHHSHNHSRRQSHYAPDPVDDDGEDSDADTFSFLSHDNWLDDGYVAGRGSPVPAKSGESPAGLKLPRI